MRLILNKYKYMTNIKEMIQQTSEKINSYDKILFLGRIASYGYIKMSTDESEDGISETTIEYCQSIAISNNQKAFFCLPCS
ncbi:MAG: hypothetical protein C5B59_08330 [Bacteroidetes bacterium]|nr:MAG: hypothetical protein C5B59_08330 [Bacteroidota bacterium]